MMNPSGRRVVVTGMGAVTPLGLNIAETWDGIAAGKSGIGAITRFDSSKLPVRIAGEVKNFSVEKYLSPKEARKMGLFIQYAIAAYHEAIADASLTLPHPQPHRVGVCVSAGMGGLPEIEQYDRELAGKERKVVTPFFVPMIIPNLANGHISILAKAQGPNVCVVTACASSAHGLGESYRYIKDGYADVMIAGGAEAVVCELGMVGFASMKALSTRNDDPQKASRPYDKNRDGFVLSEGAAVLILEELSHAQARGAKIYGEIVGYGLSSDAYHMTSPSPEGTGAEQCMRLALQSAGMNATDVDYINTHGTSTDAGDAQEAQAISRLFAAGTPEVAHKQKLHISSTKSMTGHLLGAAGALEAALCLKAMEASTVPPTINLDDLDDSCLATGLNFTAKTAVKKDINVALSNSFGFGGTNATLIFKRFK